MFTYRIATIHDIPVLTDHRMDFLIEIAGRQDQAIETQVRTKMAAYFQAAIPDGRYVSWLAICESKVVGTGGMEVRERPASFNCPNGRVGYVMNMYTLPQYRGRGICSTLLEKLMVSATELNIDVLELHATNDGEPVYRKYGFAEPKSLAMEKKMAAR